MNAVRGIWVDCSTRPTTATGPSWAAWLRRCSRSASGRNQTSSLMNITRSPVARRSPWLRLTAGRRSSLATRCTGDAAVAATRRTISGVPSVELSHTRISMRSDG